MENKTSFYDKKVTEFIKFIKVNTLPMYILFLINIPEACLIDVDLDNADLHLL